MSRSLTRHTALLAPVVALVALAGAGPAAATAPRGDEGQVRLTHLSPDTTEVDVALTPLSSPAPVTFDDIGYGEVSAYRAVPAGRYALSVRPKGSTSALPELSRTVQVPAGEAVTVAVRGAQGDVQAAVLQDDLTTPAAGKARVRLLQAARTGGALDVSTTQGQEIAQDVAFGTATGYAEVPAGSWRLRLQPSADGTASATSVDVELVAGSVQTVLALEESEGLTARVVQDARGVGRMPVGGVQTGFGAARADGLPLGLALLAGTGLLAAAGMTRTLVRTSSAGRHAA